MIFIHIPKAAGSTLIYALKQMYGRDQVWVRPGQGWPMDAPSDAPHNVRVWAGHMAYDAEWDVSSSSVTIALLRDPVERMASAYFYLCKRPRNPLHNYASACTLEEFLLSPPSDPEFDNGQVRRLVDGGSQFSLQECKEAHLEDIITRWRNGDLLLGVTEQLDASLLHFRDSLSWPPPYYWTQNQHRDRPGLDVGRNVRENVEHRNALEVRLHRLVQDSLVGSDSSRPSVPSRDLRRFQWNNRYLFRARHSPRMAGRKATVEIRRLRRRYARSGAT